MVKHFMDKLDLFNLFAKYVPATAEVLRIMLKAYAY
jgi:hypothetical protein